MATNTPNPSQNSFQWKHEYTKVIAGIAVVVILVIGGMSVVSFMKSNKETKAAESFYSVESEYEKRKEDFAKAEAPVPPKKADDKTPAPEPLKKASGTLAQDYGDLIPRFEAVINNHPGTQSALLSALTVANLHNSYKDPKAAIEILKKVEKDASSATVLGALILNMKASVLANNGECKLAVEIWEPLAKVQTLQFMHEDVALRLGLCHEALGDLKKAEEFYTNTANADRNSVAARAAQKYLRLLKLKQTPSGST